MSSSWCLSKRRFRVALVSFFFFSSRRRHTRLVSDWSSDVCSSDLLECLSRQRVIRERRHRRLEGVDRPHGPAVLLEQAVIAAAEHRPQKAGNPGNHGGMTAVARKSSEFTTPERLLQGFGRSVSADTRAIRPTGAWARRKTG